MIHLLQISNGAYSDFRHIVIFLLIGIVIGFLSGLLGKGGSAIATPALQVFGGVAPFFALASPLPASLTNALSGTMVYKKEKMVNSRVVLISLILGIPATIGGSFISPYFSGTSLMVLTAIFVLGLGISFVIPFFKHHDFITSESLTDEPVQLHPATWKIATIAIGVGGLSGLLANSGGVLFAPLFIRWLKLPVKISMACSLLVAGGLAIPGTIAHWYLGHIDWWVVLCLAVSSTPSAYLGAKVAVRLKSSTLELIFGIMLCVFGLYDIIYTLY